MTTPDPTGVTPPPSATSPAASSAAPPASSSAPPPVACARCGAALEPGFAFCESCGAPTGAVADPSGTGTPDPGAERDPGEVAPGDAFESRTTIAAPGGGTPRDPDAAVPEVPRCECGGHFEAGWCDTCGSPAPDPRDHVVTTVAPTLACVSDRGVVHPINEDAGTVVDLGAAVACVVADGVSTAKGSQAASGAAVDATGDELLAAAGSVGPDVSWGDALRRARSAAAAAAAARTDPDEAESPSCTWAAAVLAGNEISGAWVGDSRIYVVDDDGAGRLLSVDHSWATEAMAGGADHDEVMADRRAHMITAWMGADAPELPDATVHATVTTPGWLLVVSDGLWNYCDAPEDLGALVARLGGPGLQAEALCEALVGYACAAGGSDNVTVAAARLGGGPGPGEVVVDVSEPTRPGV